MLACLATSNSPMDRSSQALYCVVHLYRVLHMSYVDVFHIVEDLYQLMVPNEENKD